MEVNTLHAVAPATTAIEKCCDHPPRVGDAVLQVRPKSQKEGSHGRNARSPNPGFWPGRQLFLDVQSKRHLCLLELNHSQIPPFLAARCGEPLGPRSLGSQARYIQDRRSEPPDWKNGPIWELVPSLQAAWVLCAHYTAFEELGVPSTAKDASATDRYADFMMKASVELPGPRTS